MRFRSLTLALSLGAITGCKPKPVPETPAAAATLMPELPENQQPVAPAPITPPSLDHDLELAGLHRGDPVFVRAFKDEKRLELFIRSRKTGKFQLFRSYPIAATSGKPGPKLAEGDLQVPEGFYHVPPAAMNPNSQFHLAFNIGFPNEYDRAHHRTGTFIMVHGGQQSIGCLAMTDPIIDEIYALCDAALDRGQPFFRVHIFPFRMTADRLKAAAGDPNEDFWANLKEGYERFEKNGIPPEVTVVEGRYHFP